MSDGEYGGQYCVTYTGTIPKRLRNGYTKCFVRPIGQRPKVRAPVRPPLVFGDVIDGYFKRKTQGNSPAGKDR